jgi:hypothetical protein
MASVSHAADLWGLKEGNPGLKSARSLVFGPANILIVADTKSAAVVAIDTGDKKGDSAAVKFDIDGLQKKLAEAVGTTEFKVNDLAINPGNGTAYLSLTLGKDEDAEASIVRISGDGKISSVSLSKVKFSKVTLPNAPEDKLIKTRRRSINRRDDVVTDLAYVNGKVIVSGLTDGPSGSKVRQLEFPFVESDQGTTIEIYHGAHGRVEDYAAIRTFVPFNINGEPTLLAGYVCTPLVKFPLNSLNGKKTKGTTIAELGNRNRPLDMIVYRKDKQEFILMANDRRGVMKISTENIATNKGINERVSGTAGLTYETIEAWKGVVQLDRQSDTTATVIIADGSNLSLKTLPLP